MNRGSSGNQQKYDKDILKELHSVTESSEESELKVVDKLKVSEEKKSDERRGVVARL